MKYCTNCGKEVHDNAVVCVHCGCRLNSNQPMPGIRLNTNRSLIKYILLSLITFGIYGLVVMSGISEDINTVASRYDNKKTMHYCLIVFLFSWLTLGIAVLVWYHRISDRVGDELKRRGINYPISSTTFWGWCILGTLIIIGPFVYYHKLFTGMNYLCESFNQNGI